MPHHGGILIRPTARGRNASEILEQARRKVADFLRRPSAQVCFTSGATEANAWALNALQFKPDQIRLVSAVEHPSVLAWGDAFLEVDSEGRVQLTFSGKRCSPTVDWPGQCHGRQQ